MADETVTKEADPTQDGQDSLKKAESSSKDPITYTEEEHKKAIEDAIAQYGDKVKQEKIDPIISERDTFKTQAEEARKDAKDAADNLEDTRNEITDLKADLEEAIGEDETLLDIKKIRTELREKETKLRQEVRDEKDAVAEIRKTAEAEREEWAGTVAEAKAFKFDGEIAKVVDEYDGDVTANFSKLKTALDKAGVKTKEGAEAIAETFLTKKGVEPEILNDSGITTGGTESLEGKTVDEKLDMAYSKKKR